MQLSGLLNLVGFKITDKEEMILTKLLTELDKNSDKLFFILQNLDQICESLIYFKNYIKELKKCQKK